MSRSSKEQRGIFAWALQARAASNYIFVRRLSIAEGWAKSWLLLSSFSLSWTHSCTFSGLQSRSEAAQKARLWAGRCWWLFQVHHFSQYRKHIDSSVLAVFCPRSLLLSLGRCNAVMNYLFPQVFRPQKESISWWKRQYGLKLAQLKSEAEQSQQKKPHVLAYHIMFQPPWNFFLSLEMLAFIGFFLNHQSKYLGCSQGQEVWFWDVLSFCSAASVSLSALQNCSSYPSLLKGWDYRCMYLYRVIYGYI